MMLCAEEVTTFESDETKCLLDFESKIAEDVSTSKLCFDQISPNVDQVTSNFDQITSNNFNSCIPARVTELLSKHNSPTPLIPNEVTFNLLRIQSKFLDDHPCLCTSRFRHTLHQLGDESHLKLDKLCNDLQLLNLENCEDVVSQEECRRFYTHFLPTVFDFQSLQLYAITPDVTPEDSDNRSRTNPGPDCDKKRDILFLRLESILARLVADYRGIFAIEVECAASTVSRQEDDHPHSIVDHEHRKRHEERDTCPEEIKLMKVACAELSLECSSSSSSSSSTISPVETPKKEKRGARPKTLPIKNLGANHLVTNNNNNGKSSLEHVLSDHVVNIGTGNGNEQPSEPDKDHHIHRYYSFLRSQHSSCNSKRSSHHSTRDPNHPPRSGHWHHHQQHQHGQPVLSLPEHTTVPSSSNFLGRPDTKELSPGPQKWSPNISKATSSFRFCRNTSDAEVKKISPDVDVKKEEATSSPTTSATSGAQRKRKDPRTNPEHADSKKMSRSSSEILEEKSVSEVRNLEMEEMMRRSKSYCEVSNALKGIGNTSHASHIGLHSLAEDETDEPTVGFRASPVAKRPGQKGSCLFYVSDDEMSVQNKIDEPDYYTTLGHPSTLATDDSNGSLNARFERQMEFVNKSNRPFVRSHKNRRGEKSQRRSKSSSRRSEREEQKQLELEESVDRADDEKTETSQGVDILPRRELEREDSFDSSLSSSPSSPSSCSSTSMTSDLGELGGGEEDEEDEKDDDVTIRDDLKEESPNEFAFPQLRRASWGNIEPAVQDHQQQVDTQEPVVSWMPQIGLRRESSSSMSSDNEEFSTRHFKMLHSQKHLDPTHIQRLPTDDDSSKRSKLKQLNKQLRSLKHKLEDLEFDFEVKHGYKPSQADRQNDDKMRRVLSDQFRIRKQIQTCKESDFGIVEIVTTSLISDDSCDSLLSEGSNMLNNSPNKNNKTVETMNTFYVSLVQTLTSQRKMAGRPFSFDDMNSQQLLDEKRELKCLLFQFSQTFGQPNNDEEKNVTRDTYDRYLSIKRLIRKNSANVRAKETIELETIPEDLEIPLTLASPQHRINIEVTNVTIDPRGSEVRPSLKSLNHFSSPKEGGSSLKLIDENLHAMSRYELLEIQNRTREEKKHYRRIFKEKEEKFLKDNVLNRVPKDDKSKIDEINYNLYKKSKAKLKLIEALLSKGRQ